MSTAETETAIDEEVRVWMWRTEALERAGVGPELAQILAKGHEDLHIMVEAKAHGCDDEQLLEIFT